MRNGVAVVVCVSIAACLAASAFVAQAQSPYRLVLDWPTIPSGMFFGTRDGFPDPDARAAQQAAQRAQGGARGGGGSPAQARFGVGVAGIAIDDEDNIYVFNRGEPTVAVFNREGRYVRGSDVADQSGQPITGSWVHAGEVDWEGNAWVVERDNHRIVKLSADLSTVVMQLGTTGEPGNDETHFNLPAGVGFTRAGNIIVTDGYGNNRVAMFSKDGRFIRQISRGAGGPDDAGSGPGELALPHQVAVDASDTVYIQETRNSRVQVFDNQLNYLREFAHDGWTPWEIAISRKGDDGFGYIADHATEELHKVSLADGRIVATWGKRGRGPGEFDWVHSIAIDSEGAVYVSDTYGQRVQKFVP